MPNGKKKREPSFEVNVVVDIEGLRNLINNTRSTLIKLRKRDSVLNFETKKDDADFIFFRERQILVQKSEVRVYKLSV